MQNDDVDIYVVEGMSTLMKSRKEVDKLSSTPLDKWAVYLATMEICSTTTDVNGAIHVVYQYQYQELKQFTSAKTYHANHYRAYSVIWEIFVR